MIGQEIRRFTLTAQALEAVRTMHHETRSPCVSVVVSLEPGKADRHANTLKVRAALEDARGMIERDRALKAGARIDLLEMVDDLSPTDDDALAASARSVAIYATPEEAVVVTSERKLEPITMLSKRPFTLPLVTSLHRDESCYLLEVSESRAARFLYDRRPAHRTLHAQDHR